MSQQVHTVVIIIPEFNLSLGETHVPEDFTANRWLEIQ